MTTAIFKTYFKYIRVFVDDVKESKQKTKKHEAIIDSKENRKLHKKGNKILVHHEVQL